jgi:hypothetical protein
VDELERLVRNSNNSTTSLGVQEALRLVQSTEHFSESDIKAASGTCDAITEDLDLDLDLDAGR